MKAAAAAVWAKKINTTAASGGRTEKSDIGGRDGASGASRRAEITREKVVTRSNEAPGKSAG